MLNHCLLPFIYVAVTTIHIVAGQECGVRVASNPAPAWTKKPEPEFDPEPNPYEEPYNLIRTELSCWKADYNGENVCYNIERGDFLPDAVERWAMMEATVARMFPNEFLNSEYVKPTFKFPPNHPHCGTPQTQPYNLAHNGIEHGRYFSKSRHLCPDKSLRPHATCSIDCHLYRRESCGFMHRRWSFKELRPVSNGYSHSEATCGNIYDCMRDGHCGIFFNPERNFFSIGHVPQSSWIVHGWRGRKDANKRYDLPMASHFDHAVRVRRGNDTASALIFRIVYFNLGVPATKGYALYRGMRHEMRLRYGTTSRGIYELNAGPIPSECEAYYFYFERQDGTTIRLPEDPRYMYGTAGLVTADNCTCNENHYYDTNTDGSSNRRFVANGGPTIDGLRSCIGCIGAENIDFEDPSEAPLIANFDALESSTGDLTVFCGAAWNVMAALILLIFI